MSAGEIDLLPGEQVLWAGEPVQRPFFTKGDLALVPFYVIWLGGVLILLARENDPKIRAVLFVLFALGLLVSLGRMVFRFIRLGKTTYAITDSRVIARSGLFRTSETSDPLVDLAPPVIVPGKPGTGTITFGEFSMMAMANATLGVRKTRSGQALAVMLVGIGEPKRVRDLLIKAIEEARRRQAAQQPAQQPAAAESDAAEPGNSAA